MFQLSRDYLRTLHKPHPISFSVNVNTRTNDVINYVLEEDPELTRNFNEISHTEKDNIDSLLNNLFNYSLTETSVNITTLIKCLSLRVKVISPQSVHRKSNAGKISDTVLHLMTRIKHFKVKKERSIIENNLTKLESLLDTSLEEYEKLKLLKTPNADGVTYKELESQLLASLSVKPSASQLLEELSQEIPKPICPNNLREIYLTTSREMYQFCTSHSNQPLEINSLFVRASNSAEIFDKNSCSRKIIAVKGDTFLHILVRLLLSKRNPNISKLIMHFFVLATKHYNSGGSQFLEALNLNQESFWKIEGLTPLESDIFCLWNKKIKDLAVEQSVEGFSRPALFTTCFVKNFSTKIFDSFVKDLNKNLTNFLLTSKFIAKQETVLHALVKKIWETGEKNPLAASNLCKFATYLKSLKVKDDLETNLIVNLLDEKNCEGLHFVQLYNQLLKKYTSSTTYEGSTAKHKMTETIQDLDSEMSDSEETDTEEEEENPNLLASKTTSTLSQNINYNTIIID